MSKRILSSRIGRRRAAHTQSATCGFWVHFQGAMLYQTSEFLTLERMGFPGRRRRDSVPPWHGINWINFCSGQFETTGNLKQAGYSARFTRLGCRLNSPTRVVVSRHPRDIPKADIERRAIGAANYVRSERPRRPVRNTLRNTQAALEVRSVRDDADSTCLQARRKRILGDTAHVD